MRAWVLTVLAVKAKVPTPASRSEMTRQVGCPVCSACRAAAQQAAQAGNVGIEGPQLLPGFPGGTAGEAPTAEVQQPQRFVNGPRLRQRTCKLVALAQPPPRLPCPLVFQLSSAEADWQHAHALQAELQSEGLAHTLGERGQVAGGSRGQV